MMLYAELDDVRTRQRTADAVAVAAVLVVLLLGIGAYQLVAVAGAPGETIEDAGNAVASVPGLGGAGDALADAGRAQQDAVRRVAFWVAFGIVLIGTAAVVAFHLPRRLAWAREATAAARLRERPAGTGLLAYRAIARLPLSDLEQAAGDARQALDDGRFRPLADLELENLGLRGTS